MTILIGAWAFGLGACGDGNETRVPDGNGTGPDGHAGIYRGSMDIEFAIGGDTQTHRYQTYFLELLAPADDILHVSWTVDCHLEFHMEEEDVFSLIPSDCTLTLLEEDDNYLVFHEGELTIISHGQIQMIVEGSQFMSIDGFNDPVEFKYLFEGTRAN